ncbi:TRAP-type C4-dicarboxylate transport system substrate-binding protein [Breoghania corrubedonensis]|uniref:TRAP-type C4-dicarboxylate transport system substrate-binding protein n=1 Tax=Breoghania corrubedonensis TaxID=665038 RepID=A0A2T5UP07_9HYPH|nr:TRAP transporter substrate-binding protein [Breoghania corrubedonensis]PTW53233.1 TRAP-type C4-dicarboxylate transport system substrate-binding protein [Breoghania corrubedonensis]
MKKINRMILPAVLAAATSLATLSTASAVELRLAHWVPASHPIQKYGIEPWVKAVEEASNGRIHITIYPAQQLGAAPDHYDMTRDGITDIGYVNPGYNAGRFPIASLIEVPFLANNAKAGARAMHEWYLDYAEKEMPEVKLCVMNPHDPGTIHSKTPVHVPADVKGMNVRPANATIARFVHLLGGASVQVSAPEAREALSKGAADAITFPWNSIYIFGIDKETKYHLDMPFYESLQTLVINRGVYDGLAPEDRKVIDEHCTPEWSEKFSTGWADNEAAGREKMIESGEHTLYKPTDEEVALWKEAAAPMLDEWKKAVASTGIDADKAYDDYVAKLKKYDSLFQ